MTIQHADWVVAIGLVGLVFVARTAVRWKSGRHRRFRMTFVLEKDYEGPKGGDRPGGDQSPPDQNDTPPSS